MNEYKNVDCIPISTNANQGLEMNEVVDYLGEATTKHRDFFKSCRETTCSAYWRNNIFIQLVTK